MANVYTINGRRKLPSSVQNAYFSWMCAVTEFVYANTIILFNLGE